MSKTMLNRLAMLEVLDAAGPLTISELARRAHLDVAVVSRTVSACEPDGWVMRRGNRVSIGPRAALLGHTTPFADLLVTSTRMTHTLAGVTGLTAQALALVGNDSVVIAAAAGLTPSGTGGLAAKAPLHATAAGIAIATQMTEGELNRCLGREPYADAEGVVAALLGTGPEVVLTGAGRGRPVLPRTRAEFDDRVEDARERGWVFDAGGLDPAINCIAVPWIQSVLPAAIALIGPPEAIAGDQDLALRALRAAAKPGASVQAILAVAANERRTAEDPGTPGRAGVLK